MPLQIAPVSTGPVLSPHDRLVEAAAAVRSRLGGHAPVVGLVLGSGLGTFALRIDERVVVPYSEVPHMPVSSVAGHAGELVAGVVGGVRVACLAGRAHLYEGHAPDDAVFGVRLLAELGCHTVLLTNAAGGISERCGSRTLMLITDHLNLTGRNPLVGANEERWGTRFPDMSEAYDIRVREAAHRASAIENVSLQEGVYAGLLGPTYETPAEIRMLRTLGADAVGMSTVLEVIALRHRGVRVGALSCITNAGAGISKTPLNHEEVQEAAQFVADAMCRLMMRWIAAVAQRP
jgi:purine-nucleoside phosphorylase